MADNVSTLREGYEAFGRGDLEAASEGFADDIRWENPDAEQIPNPGATEGKDAVLAFFAEVPQHWEQFSVTADEFIAEGETVVVLGHNEGKGKETGREAKVPFVHVWRFSDGEAKRVQVLFDTATTGAALGKI